MERQARYFFLWTLFNGGRREKMGPLSRGFSKSHQNPFWSFFPLIRKIVLFQGRRPTFTCPKIALKQHVKPCLQVLQKLFMRVSRAQFIALSEFGKLRKSLTRIEPDLNNASYKVFGGLWKFLHKYTSLFSSENPPPDSYRKCPPFSFLDLG